MLEFIEDEYHVGCYFVFYPADRYDGHIGYVSRNESGLVLYSPSVSLLYRPEMLEEISAFVRGLQAEGAKT